MIKYSINKISNHALSLDILCLQYDLFGFWKCLRCLYRFLTFWEWTQHFIGEHIAYFNEYNLDNRCDYCGETFVWYHQLIVHYTKEHTRRLFMCSNCDEVFEEETDTVERPCRPRTPCVRCYNRYCRCGSPDVTSVVDDEQMDSYPDVLDVFLD